MQQIKSIIWHTILISIVEKAFNMLRLLGLMSRLRLLGVVVLSVCAVVFVEDLAVVEWKILVRINVI
jgi:hypothetical protein